jgi:hypothetical protein
VDNFQLGKRDTVSPVQGENALNRRWINGKSSDQSHIDHCVFIKYQKRPEKVHVLNFNQFNQWGFSDENLPIDYRVIKASSSGWNSICTCEPLRTIPLCLSSAWYLLASE